MVTRTFRFHAPVDFVTNESKQIEQQGCDDDALSLLSSFRISERVAGARGGCASESVEAEADVAEAFATLAVAEADVAVAAAMRACFAHIHFESGEAFSEAEALEAEAFSEAETSVEGEGSEELGKRT